MKRYVAPSICYALAFVLWLLSIYCENYALSLADLKTLTGDDVEGAIRWSNYGSASFIVSCFATAIGSWLMPWFKSWERVAFTVSVTLGYALLAWFVTIFIVLIA
ncbi:MAG: hypothetical protein HXM79_02035 [Neisseria meningitidis]|uniref:hypothetical protein n=1 Tax=Neisseria subflava TaxID=28449 RepID=UPI001CACD3CA|nr:hypothetical protein [Neisseria subflava]MBF1296333.1 hypothetical protein [Neisseria meningitidis]